MHRQIFSISPDDIAQKVARAVLLLILIGIPSISKAQINIKDPWDPRFFAGEIPQISAIAAGRDGTLYAGGGFEALGSARTGAIAKWDGDQWTALDQGLRGDVKDIEVGASGDVYVAGNLTIEPTGTTTSVARWNGRRWEDAGPPLTYEVSRLYNARAVATTPSGTVFSGGGHAFCDKWGECWVFGGGLYRRGRRGWFVVLPDLQVLDLEAGETGTVYSLTRQADGRQHIHVWDSTASSGRELPFPGEQISSVIDMVVDSAGHLVVCGRSITDADLGRRHSGVARWDGTKWVSVGTGSSSVSPNRLAVGNNGSLYLARVGERAEPHDAIVLERWTREDDWTVIDSLSSTAWGHSIEILWSEGSLFAAGGFLEPSTGVRNLARWNGATWSGLVRRGWGANAYVWAFGSGDDGSLYVGGDFSRIGGIPAAHVAKWNGDVWTSLGEGTDGGVRALAVGPDGQVFAGGEFKQAGPVQANGIARWNGNEWAPLGSGLTIVTEDGGEVPGRVSELGLDEGGRLYVAGRFDRAGDVEAANIARWDGKKWSALGQNLDWVGIGALAVLRSDSIYAGGSLNSANGEREWGVFFWDGNIWSSIGKTYSPYGVASVLALAAIGGKLYAGGYFYEIGGVEVARLAVWDGDHWQAVNSSGNAAGPSGAVLALASDPEGRLYAGGEFTWMTSILASHVAVWDGQKWGALDGGITGTASSVRALSVAQDGALMVGGIFTAAGTQSSVNIARWTGSVTMPKESQDDVSEISRLTAFPNPFVQSVNVLLRNETSQNVRLVLYDLLGREVFADDQFLMPGVHRFGIDASDLASGVYVLRAVGPDARSSITLVHVRE